MDNKLVNSFMDMVRIDSLSCKEGELAHKLKYDLKQLDCTVKEDNTGKKINGNSGNIIGELEGKSDLPTIMLSAHMDRVQPGTDIEPVLRDEYIESKGDTVLAGDDVAGIAAILGILHLLKKENVDHGKIIIIFTVAEELGLMGARHLHPDVFKEADFGLVYDAEGKIGTIVNRGPAKNKFNAVIKGKSAHAGINPGKGVNAIKIASLALSTMALGRIDRETTANIGVINGGVARNIVPDMVELEGEARSHNEHKLQMQVEHMQNIINQYVDRFKGSVSFDIELLYSSYALDDDSSIIKVITKAAAAADLEPVLQTSCGGTDANIFNQRGLPAVNLGIGVQDVHSADERLKIKSLTELVAFTLNIIKESGILKDA